MKRVVLCCTDSKLEGEDSRLPLTNDARDVAARDSSCRTYCDRVVVERTPRSSTTVEYATAECRTQHADLFEALRLCFTLGCSFGDFGLNDTLLRHVRYRDRVAFVRECKTNQSVCVSKTRKKYCYAAKYKRVQLDKCSGELYNKNVLLNVDDVSLSEMFYFLSRCGRNVYFEGNMEVFVRPALVATDAAASVLPYMEAMSERVYALPYVVEFCRYPFNPKRDSANRDRCVRCKRMTTNVVCVKSHSRLVDEIQNMEFMCYSCFSDSKMMRIYADIPSLKSEHDNILNSVSPEVQTIDNVTPKKKNYVFKLEPILQMFGVDNNLILDFRSQDNGINKHMNTKLCINSCNKSLEKLLEDIRKKCVVAFPELESYPLSNFIRLWPLRGMVCSHEECAEAEKAIEKDINYNRIREYIKTAKVIRCNRFLTFVDDDVYKKNIKGMHMDVPAIMDRIVETKQNGGSTHYLEVLNDDTMQCSYRIVYLEFRLSYFSPNEYQNKKQLLIHGSVVKAIFMKMDAESVDDLFKAVQYAVELNKKRLLEEANHENENADVKKGEDASADVKKEEGAVATTSAAASRTPLADITPPVSMDELEKQFEVDDDANDAVGVVDEDAMLGVEEEVAMITASSNPMPPPPLPPTTAAPPPPPPSDKKQAAEKSPTTPKKKVKTEK